MPDTPRTPRSGGSARSVSAPPVRAAPENREVSEQPKSFTQANGSEAGLAQAAAVKARDALTKSAALKEPELSTGTNGTIAVPSTQKLVATPPSSEGTETRPLLSNGELIFSEVSIMEHRPQVATAAAVILSVTMALLSRYQEGSGTGAAAFNSEHPDVEAVSDVNNMWLMISTALVMLMTPALSLYYGGMVKDGKVLNRMVRTFVCLGIVGCQWLFVGYSLCFAPSNPNAFNLVGDFSFAAMQGVGPTPHGLPAIARGFGIPHLTFMSFQLMFASITTTILSGAIAEYMSFRGFCLFILLWTTFVYDPICHAIWGEGLMSWHLDFAGGTVIHLLSGVSAVAAATYLRYVSKLPSTLSAAKETEEALDPAEPTRVYKTRKIERRESFDDKLKWIRAGTAKAHETEWDRGLGGPTLAQSATYVVLGATLIWFGWFGFNGGSAIAPNEVAANAIANTNFAAAFAMVAWLTFEYMTGGNPSAVGAATGVVCGLVAITPCAGYVPVLVSGPIGIIGALSSFMFVWIDQYYDIFNALDNPMDVFGTHGVSALTGSLCTGIFAYQPSNPSEVKLAGNGLLYGGGTEILGLNAAALCLTSIYGVSMTVAVLSFLKVVLGADGLLSASLFFTENIKVKQGDRSEDP